MKIDGEQCIIEAQEEKVCFFGKVVEILFSADADGEFWGWHELTVIDDEPIRVTRKQLLEAITQNRLEKDTEAWFGWADEYEAFRSPIYGLPQVRFYARVAVNALTIGKTVGELRALLAWVKEAV